jgi:hypothetical protein
VRGTKWGGATSTSARNGRTGSASTSKAGQRSSKRPKLSKVGWVQICQWLALSIALGGWAFFLLTNPRFTIRQIHIDGLQTLNVSKISTVAQIPPHTNMFLFLLEHRGAFCARVRACDPVIQNATVAVDFPNALRLHIYERQPYAVLQLTNQDCYLMDANRIVYRPIALNQTQLPIITVPSSPDAIIEGQPLPSEIDNQAAAAQNLLNLIAERQIGPLSDLSGVSVDRYGNVNLQLHNQLIIKLGQPDGMPDRLTLAEAALAADPDLTTKAFYLDFTTPRPAYLPKPSPGGTVTGETPPSSNTTSLSSIIGQ